MSLPQASPALLAERKRLARSKFGKAVRQQARFQIRGLMKEGYRPESWLSLREKFKLFCDVLAEYMIAAASNK